MSEINHLGKELPDSTPVDLEAELKASNVQEVMDTLDRELIGLRPVKTRIREIAALLLVDRLRKQFALISDTHTPYEFYGQPWRRQDHRGVAYGSNFVPSWLRPRRPFSFRHPR